MPGTESRNIALVGHNGTGKTSLAEALLCCGGAIPRKGDIASKNTVADFDPDEKDRGTSLVSAVLHVDHNDRRVNLIDCPGAPDFIGGVVEGLAAADTALITINAVAGIEVMTRKLWGMAEVRGLARFVCITKMDQDRAKYDEIIAQMKEAFGASITPLLIPVGTGPDFKGVVNLLDDPSAAPAEVADKVQDLASGLVESVVSADEGLMERYLNDEKIPPEELAGCFTQAVLSGALTPVLCASGEKDIGVKEVLDVLATMTPKPNEVPRKISQKSGEEVEEKTLEGAEDGPLYAQVFKSIRDPFMGKISYLRVLSGSLATGGTATNQTTGQNGKYAHFLEVQGKDTKEINSVKAGDIFALAKYEDLNCGDTLTTESGDWKLEPLPYPRPMYSLAVSGASRKDEGRIAEQLRALADNDPTFVVEVDPQTKELVVHAIGQIHMDLMFARLKKSNVEVTTRPPKIPYRSTITDTVEIRYRHKKQTGGAGQFGEVQIVAEPNPEQGYEFIDEIVGGVIPNTLIPSVDKGIIKKMTEGVWPGVPVVDVKVRLNDGKTHPVDSKDIAFQIAGREAFRQAFEKAKPVLIEPIVSLEVMIPTKYMGDITGHLSGKRGRIQGMDQMGDMQVVKAQVPASEVQGYAGELKAITGGEGFYSMEYSHYEQVPSNLAQPVIKAAQSNQKEDAD